MSDVPNNVIRTGGPSSPDCNEPRRGKRGATGATGATGSTGSTGATGAAGTTLFAKFFSINSKILTGTTASTDVADTGSFVPVSGDEAAGFAYVMPACEAQTLRFLAVCDSGVTGSLVLAKNGTTFTTVPISATGVVTENLGDEPFTDGDTFQMTLNVSGPGTGVGIQLSGTVAFI